MTINLILFIFINICFALWIVAIHFFYFPLFLLKHKLTKAGIKTSVNLFAHQLITKIEGERISIGIMRWFKGYKIKIKLPYATSFTAELNNKCKKKSEYFLFAGSNLFLNTIDEQTMAYFSGKRSLFQTIMTKYSTVFHDNKLTKAKFSHYSMVLETDSNRLDNLISDLPEIRQFAKEIQKLVSLSSQNEHRALRERGVIASNKILISVVLLTAIMAALIGISASIIELKQLSIPPLKNDTYIQVWEIHKDFANVYDISEDDHNKKLISKNIAALTEYAGFKPESVPWGFRVSPKLNYRHHYKILIFPKDTELLGFINYTPIKQFYCSDYLLVIYDLSEIKEKSYINIYMHYRGQLLPINIKKTIPHIDALIYEEILSPSFNIMATENGAVSENHK